MATSLADSIFSQTGEQKIEEVVETVIPPQQTGLKVEGVDEIVIFKLTNTKRKGGVWIPGVDDVINPKTNNIERVRLLSGIPTIWQSEQKDLTPDYIKANQRSLHFPRGAKILRISKKDKAALEFARICNHNTKNPNRTQGSRFEFFEYDPIEQQKLAHQKEMEELNAAIEASKREVEPMKKHAAYLGIRLNDDYGFVKTDEGVRQEYILYAKRNPKLFQETIASPKVEVAFLIRKALSQSLIDIGRGYGNIEWSKTKSLICVMPQGVNAVDYLIDLALTNTQEGKDFKDNLQRV